MEIPAHHPQEGGGYIQGPGTAVVVSCRGRQGPEEMFGSSLEGLVILGAGRDQVAGKEGASLFPLSREAGPPESWATSLCVSRTNPCPSQGL